MRIWRRLNSGDQLGDVDRHWPSGPVSGIRVRVSMAVICCRLAHVHVSPPRDQSRLDARWLRHQPQGMLQDRPGHFWGRREPATSHHDAHTPVLSWGRGLLRQRIGWFCAAATARTPGRC